MNQTWKSRKNATQTLDFSTVSFGRLHPADIDAAFEYKNMGILLFEVKCRDATLGTGQRLMLERMIDRGIACGKHDRALLIDHYVYDADDDIDLGSCTIRCVYAGSGWNYIKDRGITVKEYIITWMAECDELRGKRDTIEKRCILRI